MSLHNNWMKNTTDTDPRSTYVRLLLLLFNETDALFLVGEQNAYDRLHDG